MELRDIAGGVYRTGNSIGNKKLCKTVRWNLSDVSTRVPAFVARLCCQPMTKLNSTDWAEVFDTSGADEAAERFVAPVLDTVEACVPSRWITEKLHAHPWRKSACSEAAPVFSGTRTGPT